MRITIATCSAGRDVNEDAGGALGEVAVVVDGAGVPASMRAGCSHSVAWYSHALAAGLLRHGQRADTLREALRAAIRDVRAEHEGTCALDAGSPSATVAMARRHDAALDYLVLGDAALLHDGPDGVRLVTDTRLDDLRPAHPGTAIEAMRNVDGGFWVARHEDRCADEAIVGRVDLPLESARRADADGDDGRCRTGDDAAATGPEGSTGESGGVVHLVSDGVLRALEPVGSHDPEALARDLAVDPEAFLRRLRASERELPVDRRPRKLHDDATVVSLRL